MKNFKLITALFVLIILLATNGIAQTNLVISGGNFVVSGNYLVLENTKLVNNSTFHSGSGTVVISGDAANANAEIGGTSPTTFYNLTIDKTSNGTQLGNDINISNQLNLTNGTIDIQTNDLTIENTGSISGGSLLSFIKTSSTGVVIQEVGGSNVIFPIGNQSFTPLMLNNAGTTDNFKVRVASAVYQNGTTGSEATTDAVDATWFIEETIAGGSDVTATFQWYITDELTNFDRTQAFVSYYEGGMWNNGADQVASGSNPYILSMANISTFSPFIVASDAVALPVELLYFYGEKEEDNTLLTWETTTEINNSHFDVEWSIDGINFDKIGEVTGAGTTTEQQFYDFLHENPANGKNYYRLKQVDFDEKSEYTNIILITFEASKNLSIKLYPNPTSDYFNIESNYEGTVQLFDVAGRLIIEKNISKKDRWDISRLAGGTYFIKIGKNTKKLIIKK